MIAVTCSSCRLRFEAPAIDRRIHGEAIVCPACDAGEPVVLDLLDRATSGSARLQLTPPALDMAELDAVRGPSPSLAGLPTPPLSSPARPSHSQSSPSQLSSGAMPDLVYVDFDEPEAAARAAEGGAGRAALGTFAVALAASLAFAISWPMNTTPRDGTLVATAPVATTAQKASDAFGAPDDALVTASIAPTQTDPRPRIARVLTELSRTDDGRVLSVRTDLHNEADATIPVPPLRISIRAEDGTVLHRWTTRAKVGDSIDPGETRAVSAETDRIPEGAADVKVDFARR